MTLNWQVPLTVPSGKSACSHMGHLSLLGALETKTSGGSKNKGPAETQIFHLLDTMKDTSINIYWMN